MYIYSYSSCCPIKIIICGVYHKTTGCWFKCTRMCFDWLLEKYVASNRNVLKCCSWIIHEYWDFFVSWPMLDNLRVPKFDQSWVTYGVHHYCFLGLTLQYIYNGFLHQLVWDQYYYLVLNPKIKNSQKLAWTAF
jgi:hypothetical protein